MKLTGSAGLLLCAAFSAFALSPTERTQQKLNTIKNNPPALMQFLKAMPKGGDLHMHESGSTMAENMLNYAANDPLCVNRQSFSVYIDPACPAADILQTALLDPLRRDQLINAWSMRAFDRNGKESGHDHFFNTFGKYSPISWTHRGEILAEITVRAEEQHVNYLEIMLTPDRNKARQLGQRIGYDPDFASMRQKLLAAGMADIVADMTQSLNDDEAQQQSILGCGNGGENLGCQVTVRYLYQAGREQAPEMVFAQLLAGFEAARMDSRIVGINLVQPEDGLISMRDYNLHMQMIQFLHQLYPDVKITLHAGELNETLVPQAGLTFHIHDAVKVGGASRIGHGVDISYETNAQSLLHDMHNENIMVEINLTSNDYILNVKGDNHPLRLYLNAGVAVALSTDDEGVSRENLTMQFQRAVQDNHINYIELKNMVRNSLFFAFISGENFWKTPEYKALNPACEHDEPLSKRLSGTCQAFLENNPKATLQWQLEKQLAAFENSN